MQSLYNYDGAEVIKLYSTPEMYGAVGDGTTDDTSAIQSAINNKGLIVFENGKTYKVTAVLRVKKDTIINLNGATILSTNKHLFYNFTNNDVSFVGYNGNGNITICNGNIVGGAISFAHGENILLDGVRFSNCLNDHFLEIAGCKNYIIRDCSFIGMDDPQTSVYEYINVDPCTRTAFPWMPDGSTFFDGTKNDGITVDGCYFSLGSDSYAHGYNAFGVHGVGGQSAKHKNIRLVNNILRAFTGCGFRINDMEEVYIANNDIQVDGDGIRVGDVGACEDITIIDNFIVSDNGTRIALTTSMYTGLTTSGNIVKGTVES